jgi:hypothetical protein
MSKKKEKQAAPAFPRIPLPWYQRLMDPWTFYENVKRMVWDTRWLLGYIEELESKAQVKPDALSERIREALSDIADDMCIVCNKEVGDYTPKKASDRKKDLKNLSFSPRKEKRTLFDDDDEVPENDELRHENMLKIVQKSRQKRRKKGE